MRRFKEITCAAILAAVTVFPSIPSIAAELDRRQQTIVRNLAMVINKANKSLFEGKKDLAENDYRRAMDLIGKIVEQNNADMNEAIEPHLKMIRKTHAMLELEGASVPPFRIPESSADSMSDNADPDSPMTPGSPTPPGSSPTGLVSFKDDVAPILANKCGSCHVTRSQGRFSLASYQALMKGPPEGVVVFAGDVIGSRLIETIETGDMPRGGGQVTPAELKTLKDWIIQGAKFDGTDPSMTISANNNTPAPAPAPTPMITKATGKETVSFASDIAPLLVDNCSGCHIDAMQTRGGLQMDTFARLMRGGDTGPVITPGRGEASLIVQKLRGTAADGARMPVGRPALSDDAIALISKWIDEGATLDAEESQPLKVIARLAWVANASSADVSKRRAELAQENLQLAGSTSPIAEFETEHFRVVGPSSKATLELVGKSAEQHITTAKTVAKVKGASSGEDYFHGKATIFVFPKRYDYSEFAKMAEQRSVPADWSSHWRFDGEDAYVVAVATEREEEEAIENRLQSPVISLAVASRGIDVPRWFAEGIGSARAIQTKSRNEQAKLRTKIAEAASSVKDAKAFLENRLTPEQADAFGTALAMTMLDRNRKKMLDNTFRFLAEGRPFEQAFTGGFGVTPAVYIDQFLNYAR
ncbi:hypothetical protein LOC67_07120 [Stieleria sp. JC731]|uniref:c-type cytochrome domain-containing protein n=1 Tax=Pirellulaceae TaxID=2691357 RepID=UPI001E283D5B|nr:c-type cytochrome domain-containing protein [Stieleria sp. JC731]MCC9600327.1 hypothetical protein [Stieleria sp. JC731]